MQNPSRGFFKPAHDGIGIQSYFYSMRFIDIYQTKKSGVLICSGSAKKLITVTEQVPRGRLVGLVQILRGGSLGTDLHSFHLLPRLRRLMALIAIIFSGGNDGAVQIL